MIKPFFRTATLALTFIASVPLLHAQGVMIHDASTASLLDIDLSHITVNIVDQVALVSSTQRFTNNTSDTLAVKYGYPLAATASATRVRWMLPDSSWHTASMVAEPQDTTLPGLGGGSSMDAALEDYLGGTPLYFNINDPVPPGAWISVELSYVELLPYANARVELVSPSDYSQLISGSLPDMVIDATVRSQRAITGIDISGTGSWSPPADAPYVSSDSASIHVDDQGVPASCGFAIGYDLDPLAYGLTAMSNYLPDSLVRCDELGNGFFVLLIEPEPTSEVVDKDFVIVIDKSGSMSGTKINEAKSAASFMVNHLNAGDAFNVIAFESTNHPWSSGLQPFTAANMTSALNWIGQIAAGGGTNINDAITLGIDNFTSSDPGSARSIVFLTDGQDQSSNAVILANAQQLRLSIAPDLQLFTFGIGEGYNEQLLNQLAVQNNGVSQFLETANFSQVMSDFYTQIQNPVLLGPTATFDHPDIEDTYPEPLLGLYVGQQMVIVGRYDVPGIANLHLDGSAFGNLVSFDFGFDLSAVFDEDKQFVTKVWAQKAVDALVNEYYTYTTGSQMAETIRDSIVNYSMCYGVGSPFTSFADPGNGGNGGVGFEEQEITAPAGLLAYPDPSSGSEPITIDLRDFAAGAQLVLRIYDALGQLVYEADLSNASGGTWTWNCLSASGEPVKGPLFLSVSDGINTRTARITRL